MRKLPIDWQPVLHVIYAECMPARLRHLGRRALRHDGLDVQRRFQQRKMRFLVRRDAMIMPGALLAAILQLRVAGLQVINDVRIR